MLHKWNKETDGTGSTVTVVLFYFKKAFYLIDHNILIEKLSKLDLPSMVMSWITDFLQNRKQRVKLSNDCYSEWGNIPAGVPQGTKLGPWLFTVMINDLEVTGVDLWKFVDDTTLSETIFRHQISAIQDHVDDFTKQSHANNFVLNEEKCKEMRISFRKTDPSFDPVVINDKSIELVESVKILGLNISNDLKWKIHIFEIARKVSSRLYFLKQLKRAGLEVHELRLFYLTCVRPLTEYACPVFHNSLPTYLSDDLEILQKRALRIIFPHLSYQNAMREADIETLYDRRESLTRDFFNKIIQDSSHKLHTLLPDKNQTNVNLRVKRMFKDSVCKTDRFRKSFLPTNANNRFLDN